MADIITTLHPHSDENINLYPNIKADNIPNKSIGITKLSDDIISTLGSLKPSGVDTSANILAFTSNKGIWVASDNGEWYYWDGTQYVSGGVYQSAVNFDEQVHDYSIDYQDNKYIYYTNGTIDSLTGNKLVTLYVNNVSEIYYDFTLSTPDVRGLVFFDINGRKVSGVQALTTAQTITVPSSAVTCKATVTNLNQIRYKYNSSVLSQKMDTLIRTKSVSTIESTYVSGKYVTYSNGVIDSLGSENYVTMYVKGGDVLEYTYTLSTPDIRGLAFYDINGTYISGYKTLANAQTLTAPSNACICKATVRNVEQLTLVKNASEFNKNLNELQEDSRNLDILYAYDNITCVGDSLTYGVVYTDGNGGYRRAKKPYPSVLGVKYNLTVDNLASGGYTALDWWNNYNDSIVEKTNQIVLIWLGTNGSLTDTLSTDAPSGTNYSTWASTNTGSYAKIVAKYQENNAKIILVKTYNSDVTNSVIEQIATRFGCGLIDNERLTNLKYHYYPDYSGYNSLHYNDLGYSALANLIIHNISKMDENYMKYIIPE